MCRHSGKITLLFGSAKRRNDDAGIFPQDIYINRNASKQADFPAGSSFVCMIKTNLLIAYETGRHSNGRKIEIL
jgi:hypothetical protein